MAKLSRAKRKVLTAAGMAFDRHMIERRRIYSETRDRLVEAHGKAVAAALSKSPTVANARWDSKDRCLVILAKPMAETINIEIGFAP